MMAAIFLTEGGKSLARKLKTHYPELRLYTTEALADKDAEAFQKPLSSFISSVWKDFRVIIFISALGIAARAVAPSIKSKLSDPAVICIDEKGSFVISLLSGHLGGANALAREIAEKIEATPVITTSTDVQGKPCLEDLAKRYSLIIENPEDIKKVNSALANGKPVAVLSDYLQKAEGFPLYTLGSRPEGYHLFILVTNKLLEFEEEHIYLRPRNLIAGIGFSTRVKAEEIAEKIKKGFSKSNLSIKSLTALATVDFKAESHEIKRAAELLSVDVIPIPAEEIKKVEEKFESSDFVRASIGLGSVAEPCAFIASGGGRILLKKTALDGMTLAVAEVRR